MNESEEKFRKISDSANDAIIMADNDSRITYWNRAAEEMFGYLAEDVVGTKLHQSIIPARFQDAHLKGFNKFCDTGQGNVIGKTVELAAIRKDKTEFPIELSLSSVKVGDRWNAVGIIRDISDRKKAERRLNAQHAVTQILSASITMKDASVRILQAICESLNWEFGAMWFYHHQDNVLRCSDLWHIPDIEVLEFKKSTEEITFAPEIGLPGRVWTSGKPAWIVDVVHDPNFPRAPYALKEGLHAAFGFPIIYNEEVLGTLEFFSKEKEEPDNDLLNMMSAVGIQIGLFIKRNQSEEVTRKLSRAVEQSPATIVITNVKGNIEYVNPKFFQLTGYSFEEVIGKNPRILKSGVQSDAVYKEMWNTISSGNEWSGEFCNKKKNNDLYWESVSISPITNNEGTITHYVAIKEDITNHRKIEKELRESHKMMSLGRLTASVFHEILNPVNIIASHTQLLLMEAEKGSNTEEDLLSIQGEIKRIVNITDNLRTLSQNEGNEVVNVEINGLLENTLELINPELNIKSIKPILKLEKGLPEVMAHGSEIGQAFLNIVSNAIEAMPDGGTLTIVTQCVQNKGLPLVRISVIDTGCGIANDIIDKIFEPFYSTKKEIKGVGLGLSSSYTIINGCGGKLSVESEEGNGATFIIDLPVKL